MVFEPMEFDLDLHADDLTLGSVGDTTDIL